MKSEEIEVLKRAIQGVRQEESFTEKEKEIKDKINVIDNVLLEAELLEKQLTTEQRQFAQIKKTKLKEADRMEADAEKTEKQLKEIDTEILPQARADVEDRKDKRRDMERELKALKEGKDNSASQLTALGKEIADAKNKEQQHIDRMRASENEMNFKQRQLKDLD